jgi:putative DNA primase/helicase
MVLDKNDPFAAEMAALGPVEFDPASYRTGEQEPQQERQAKKRKPLTDIINEDTVARQFAKVYAGKLLYCHGRNAWYVWDGSLWQIDQTDQVFQWVRELTRQLCASEPKDRTRFVCNATRFAKGVEVFARSDPTFAVTAEAWDRDRFLLGTPDGTVDLETGKLRQSEPSDRITRSTAIAPSNHADCPLWLQFLEEATGGDADLIRFLQQWSGYALTGDTREHALVFIYGPGGNGKSVFLNVLTAILNTYGTTAAMDTFTASKSDKHPTDLAMLRGARLVTASETEEGKPRAEARIKQMTGGDPITARYMRQDFFTFIPHFKLTIVGNHQPVLRNVDEASRRRFNIIPFTRKPERPDPQLEEKLKAEYPAVLRWMIEGCRDWQRNRLTRAASVVAATADYFVEQDLFAQWLEEQCDVDIENSAKWEYTTDLFASWSAYARAAGEEPGTAKSFAPAMRRKGFKPYRRNQARGWCGIRLKDNQPAVTGDAW